METGDRLCIQTKWSARNNPGWLNIVFATGYSYPSQPPLPSGWAGIIDAKEHLLKRGPCSYNGAVISALIEKKHFGNPPHDWSSQFWYANTWFARHGAKVPMFIGTDSDSMINFHGNDAFFQFLPHNSYNADKPTFLPPDARK